MAEIRIPPPGVVAAFGASGPVDRLPGGQGTSVRAGDLVFKPVENRAETEWASAVLERLDGAPGFRVPAPVRAADGHFVRDSWSASRFVATRPAPENRWPAVLAAGRSLHRALLGVPAPAFLPTRRHPWAVGDRVAWGEEQVTAPDAFRPTLARLLASRHPVPADSQLIHGDLSGNVLFPDHGDPVIIDFSPYWRPPAFADATVIADALMYFDAATDVIDLGLGPVDYQRQMLIRAVIFRLVAHVSRTDPTAPDPAGAEPFRRAADLIAGKESWEDR